MSTAELDEQIERLKRCDYLKENEVKALCDRAREILMEESNVQRVDSPVTVSLIIPSFPSFSLSLLFLLYLSAIYVTNLSLPIILMLLFPHL